MRCIKIFVTFFILSTYCIGQIPAGYYDAASGKTGAELKTALYNIIKNHTVRSYPLWTWYDDTDLQPNGKIWDIYSDNCNFVFSTNQCGSYSNICDCYNNEHSFPKSWFNDVSPMNSDIFHIYPTDGKVNGMRSNYPYGETNGTTWGNGKLGACSFPGYTGTVFEPSDQYKGDLARTFFYMATRYENVFASWENYDTYGNAMMNGTSYPCFETWALNLLLKWHQQDPVSQKEIDRNNKIYSMVQFNRNPFIDHPEFVNCIWNNDCNTNISDLEFAESFASIFPNPAKENIYIVFKNQQQNIQINLKNIQGVTIQSYSKTLVNANEQISLNIDEYTSGLYFLIISTSNYNYTKKILIQ